MFKKISFLVFILGLFFSANIYAQESVQSDADVKPKDAYMMEDIKNFLTQEENEYFMTAQKKMEGFLANNKDLENYLTSAVQGILKGDKKSVYDMFVKVRMEIEKLIKELNTLTPPTTLVKYHKLNIEALELLVKKLDPDTITDQTIQKKLDEEGEEIVAETNKEIENLIKTRQHT